eukprot:3211431-Prymnesium_polylepis.2
MTTQDASAPPPVSVGHTIGSARGLPVWSPAHRPRRPRRAGRRPFSPPRLCRPSWGSCLPSSAAVPAPALDACAGRCYTVTHGWAELRVERTSTRTRQRAALRVHSTQGIARGPMRRAPPAPRTGHKAIDDDHAAHIPPQLTRAPSPRKCARTSSADLPCSRSCRTEALSSLRSA